VYGIEKHLLSQASFILNGDVWTQPIFLQVSGVTWKHLLQGCIQMRWKKGFYKYVWVYKLPPPKLKNLWLHKSKREYRGYYPVSWTV
jgi:hypothetical protein